MNEKNDYLQPTYFESRPKCSVSPLNELENTQLNFNDSNILINPHLNISQIDTNSPFVNRICYAGGLYPFTQSTHHDSGLGLPLGEVSANISPMCAINPRVKKSLLNVQVPFLQYQSTPNKFEVRSESVPNKKKTNFHSIVDLAKSSDDSANYSATNTDTSSSHLSCSSVNKSTSVSSVSTIGLYNNINILPKRLEASTTLDLYTKENALEDRNFIYKTKRKARAQISKQQREILEYAYRVKCYPDSAEVEYLCSVLGFEENVIRVSIYFNIYIWLRLITFI